MARANVNPIKAREKQRRDAARNLHLLADVARDAFESRKAELKGDGVQGRLDEAEPLLRRTVASDQSRDRSSLQ